MSKYRSMISFSLKPELYDEFNEYCKENSINRSALISKFMRDYLDSNKKEKEKEENFEDSFKKRLEKRYESLSEGEKEKIIK